MSYSMPRKAGGDAKAKRRKLAFMERQAAEAAADDADELSGDGCDDCEPELAHRMIT